MLAIFLRERAPETLVQRAKIADQHLEAHGKHLFSSASKEPQVQPKGEETKTAQSDTTVPSVKSATPAYRKVLTAQL